MIQVAVTETFVRLFRKLPLATQNKASSKTKLFQQNLFHPSLKTKKLQPHHEEVWSFWINTDYRIKFRFVNPQLVHFLYIGNRKDIYR